MHRLVSNPFDHNTDIMPSIISCYLLFGLILIVYGAQVDPFLKGLGNIQMLIGTYLPIVLAIAIRIYFFRKTNRNIRTLGIDQNVAIYALPWREFAIDIVAWFLTGFFMAMLYILYLEAPFLTGLKLWLGCISFGLLGGMLCFLSAEKRIIAFLKDLEAGAGLSPKRLLSVSKKMLFFMVTVMVFMVLVVLVMVFIDINYLLTHRDSFGGDIYFRIFKEVVFAFGVLLLLSLLIIRKYSQNLKTILALQLSAMEEISRGNYETKVPVVSNDEFGLVAAKTNEMVKGLRERDFCQLSFGRYVTPEVSEKILQGEVTLEGELREVTILFCDLRGYTTFVEGRDPQSVVHFLNAYFTEMEQAIKKNHGIVLQYIGDEIEAVFGAPSDLPDHPRMALLAALEMRARLERLNDNRVREGRDPIMHGIGIHTGEVLAGSVGSPERLVYAMVGDTVNVASRIQTLNKNHGTDILVSQKTKDFLDVNEFRLLSLGKAVLKGKTEKMEIYKVG
jgi:class 3 adenylate cyclase